MNCRFAYRVRQARRDADLSQTDAAERIGVSKQYLCDIEHANRVPVSEHIVDKLSEAYGIDADLLWFDLGLLPPDVRAERVDASPEQILAAYAAMRAALKGEQP